MSSVRVIGWLAPLTLVAARVRHRPGGWLWPLIGLSVAVTFAGGVAAEAVVSADQAARSALRDLQPIDRTVRITWQGPSTPAATARALGVLRRLGLRDHTHVTLLDPVRLSGVIVHPAAVAPFGRWIPQAGTAALGPCLPTRCPMVLAGGGSPPRNLTAAGVRIELVRRAPLRSNVPLGFALAAEGQWPVVLSSDPAGLDRLSGLSGVFRANSWLSQLDTAPLHSWDLPLLQRRLAKVQAALLRGGPEFGMSAPFAGLSAARAQASAAPRSLLLAGGGAIAILALFAVLAAAGLRGEQRDDMARLRAGGATTFQLGVFVAGEALLLSAAAALLGFGGALLTAAVLAGAAGEPVGAVLAHSLITPVGGGALAVGWIVGAALIVVASQLADPRVLSLAGVAGAAALIAGLLLGAGATGRSAALLAPVCCLAAGVVVFRAALWLLPAAERLTRRGAVTVRLAVVGLARSPGAAAAAIAFTCVAVGLGGFALAYRATLQRGATDQAADRVPLDAIVGPGPSFATPLQLRPLSAWWAVSHGRVFPVRRTYASYQVGAGTATVPALGVPTRALTLLHGWRASDGSAPLPVLARRLVGPGPVRTPGPLLPSGVRQLVLRARSPQMAVNVIADLRDPAGDTRRLALGAAWRSPRTLRATVPPGRWEIEALELDEFTGTEITNGHQNGENPAPTTQFSASVSLGPLRPRWPGGRLGNALPLSTWVGVGAASGAGPRPGGGVRVRFQASGSPGVVRPRQPSDSAPVPVLADLQTAAAAGADGRLEMTIDGQPVQARIVGILRRFPTLSGASNFVVADQAVLASALDAQLPGQGRPDELWIATSRTGALRAALASPSLAGLQATYRADVERRLREAPIARAITGTLLAAAAVSGALALIGLLLIVHGPLRDRRLAEDLAAQGLGPAALRFELLTRLALAGALGIVPGVGLALLLDRLAVAAVGSVSGQPPVPPLVTVVPAEALAIWVAGAAALVVATAWLATRWLIRDDAARRDKHAHPRTAGDDGLREEWAR